ncbi:MAG: hypothetical protein FGM57_03010, partial [Candidatus Taylorbacteria bacterium]|nr:hypothetical protein [Candidatus Taylorbacteria bacterium]
MAEFTLQMTMTNIFLSQKITSIARIDSSQEKALQKLGVSTIKDVLYHIPTRYDHSSSAKLIRDIVSGEQLTVYGKIRNLKTGKSFRSKVSKAEGILDDDTGTIKLLWFHQPYIAKIIQNDSLVKVSGKVSERNGHLSLLNPHIESVSEVPQNIGDTLFEGTESDTYIPIYPESKGVTSRWFFNIIRKIFSTKEFAEIEDPIPNSILKKYNLPSLSTALIWLHTPKKESDAEVA